MIAKLTHISASFSEHQLTLAYHHDGTTSPRFNVAFNGFWLDLRVQDSDPCVDLMYPRRRSCPSTGTPRDASANVIIYLLNYLPVLPAAKPASKCVEIDDVVGGLCEKRDLRIVQISIC